MIQVHERTYLERVDTKNIKNFQIGKFTAMIILHFHLQPQFKNELFHILHIRFRNLSRNKINMSFPRKVLININSEELSIIYFFKYIVSIIICLVIGNVFYLGVKIVSFVFLTLIDNLLAFNCGAGR